jgi:hypothetical protein
VFVPELVSVELLLVFGFEDLLELVLEETIVGFQDGVFCSELNGHFSHQRIGEHLVGEVCDGLSCVVHAKPDTALALEIENLSGNRLATVGWGEHQLQFAGTWEFHILAFVLVTI